MPDGAYTTGTVSLAAGSKSLTGTGTAWEQFGFRAGDKFFAAGYVMVIDSVDSDTAITLTEDWPGAALSDATYRMEFQPSLARSTSTYAEAKAALNSPPPFGIVATFDSTTTAGDPGSGGFRLDNAAPASVTKIYISDTDLYGTDIGATLASWTGGQIKVMARGNAAVWASYDVSAVAAGTGYHTLTVTPVDAAGTLTGGAACLIGYAERGEDGTDGADGADGIFTAIATEAEAEAGTNNTKGMTPLRALQLVEALGWSKDTAVGTVSQSSGTPTGAIVEQGSNSNGTYVRFAGGLQICMATVTAVQIATSTLSASWTFPAAFSSAPLIGGSFDVNAFKAALRSGIHVALLSAASAQVRLGQGAGDAWTSSDTATIYVIAAGVWY